MNFILLQALGSGLTSFLPMIGIAIVFYLFFIRPQNKQRKESKQLLENLKKGDKIVTSGGLHGRILQDNGTNFTIDFGGNTKIKVEKASISMELTKTLTDDTIEKA